MRTCFSNGHRQVHDACTAMNCVLEARWALELRKRVGPVDAQKHANDARDILHPREAAPNSVGEKVAVVGVVSGHGGDEHAIASLGFLSFTTLVWGLLRFPEPRARERERAASPVCKHIIFRFRYIFDVITKNGLLCEE